MKQIDECLTRAIKEKKKPLNGRKWKAFLTQQGAGEEVLYLYHYHHRVLVYHMGDQKVMAEWWEKPTDKRGLDSAKAWLREYHQNKPPLA